MANIIKILFILLILAADKWGYPGISFALALVLCSWAYISMLEENKEINKRVLDNDLDTEKK